MQKYVLRRLLLAVPVLLLSSLIVFSLMRVMPGDALIALMGESGNVGEKELAKLRKNLGLDRPYHEQYAIWLWQMASLSPGDSIFTNEPIPVSLRKAIPVLLLSSLIVFGLMRVMPGDALIALMGESGNVGQKELAKLRKDLGLDRPYHEQYLLWLWQMVSFSPGDSIFTNEPISVSLKKAIPVTLELAALAIVLGITIAVPIGVLSATRQDTAADYAGRVVAVSGLSIPDFWLATLVITFSAIWVHWIPPIGYVSFWDSPWRNLQQFLLPAAVLGYRLAAATMRMTRSTVLETLREDYVRTAWAKGLAGRIVVYKHALKNALIPVVTIIGGQLGTLLAGTFVIEQIFALPGMGRLTVEAILYRDYPVVQTNVMLVAAILVTLNLIVDLTYAWLDPRIRYQ